MSTDERARDDPARQEEQPLPELRAQPQPGVGQPPPQLIEWCGAIERLAWGGLGVGRLDDERVVLLSAPLALFPGEVVRAQVRLKARHGEGEVLEWLEADPRRQEPRCPVAQRCGGCSLWGAGALAGELKRQMAADLLRRQGIDALLDSTPESAIDSSRGSADDSAAGSAIDSTAESALDSAPRWDWLSAPSLARRSRIQLHWDGAHLGYYARASNRVVPIEACPMALECLSAASASRRGAQAR